MIENCAVITGASMGLGKELALSCARKGFNLVLIALPDEGIIALADDISKKFKIKTVGIESDLTVAENIKNISKEINQKYKVKILINNAGIGGSNSFMKVAPEYLDNIVLLNIRALVMLTHSLLPNLRKHPKSYILNIASMASFGPMPFKTVYPASKAFVYSFTRGLSAELKASSVLVSVAHPGGMATNPDVIKRIKQYNQIIKSTILSPERISEICIRQVLKGDTLIIPGIMNKLSWLFFKVFPVWLQLIIFKRTIIKEVNLQNK